MERQEQQDVEWQCQEQEHAAAAYVAYTVLPHARAMLMSSSKPMQMERQKQQDEEWQRLEQERQQALEAKEEGGKGA